MAKSTPAKKKPPAKPYADFPLFPHANGHWAKKIRGRRHYFGPWSDWKSALDLYTLQRDDLQAGRAPRANADGLTVAELCNRFLTCKQSLLDNGELARRTFDDYQRVARVLVEFFGRERPVDDLTADDEKDTTGPTTGAKGGDEGEEKQRAECRCGRRTAEVVRQDIRQPRRAMAADPRALAAGDVGLVVRLDWASNGMFLQLDRCLATQSASVKRAAKSTAVRGDASSAMTAC